MDIPNYPPAKKSRIDEGSTSKENEDGNDPRFNLSPIREEVYEDDLQKTIESLQEALMETKKRLKKATDRVQDYRRQLMVSKKEETFLLPPKNLSTLSKMSSSNSTPAKRALDEKENLIPSKRARNGDPSSSKAGTKEHTKEQGSTSRINDEPGDSIVEIFVVSEELYEENPQNSIEGLKGFLEEAERNLQNEYERNQSYTDVLRAAKDALSRVRDNAWGHSRNQNVYRLQEYLLDLAAHDMLVVGMDTSDTAVEWTMSELIRHPRAMKKLQKELEEVVGMNRMAEESDLDKLNYLDMVVKE
ncbi:amorpha-4,11-diene 12-monooxygenase-like [Tripterygium wilfordii]|nr:amorpha-4,11-diene 12-monooxygenase-like [Tripterygium wilfordii]